ncbi:AMP-dependent synthetase/ligase [Psychroflexus salinarum]|uniref:AMP-dependent synthetase/ligase n=1 Tax=Psychroflexus salinarum TaxID=546024 RepID=A0ABW3GP86_9FLAO
MDIKLLFEIPHYQKENFPSEVALAGMVDEEWCNYSTQEYIDQMNKVSLGLLHAGVKKEEKIGLISFNRPEWNFIDLGIQQIGAICVPMYPNVGKEQYKYMLEESEVTTLFVEDEELYNMIDDIKDELKKLKHVYTFNKVKGATHWTIITDEANQKNKEELLKRRQGVTESDLATIVYTSGTTGDPKGVMLSHENIMSNVKACLPLLPIDEGSKSLSFLPLNHIFERMLSFVYMASGVSIYYTRDIDNIAHYMKEVKPDIFTAVPRLLEKIYEKIKKKGAEQNFIKRGLFFGSIWIADQYELNSGNVFYNSFLKIADKLVFSQWREALGGDVKLIISGGAALNPKLARIFTAAGLPILEGYGLTETSPVISVNRWELENRKLGTVGKPLENVEVKISEEDNEILCKGPNVMMGYYKKEEETREVLKDGWLYSDDIGEIDDDGFLKVKDRKDSVFKTSGGKKVAPQPIENKCKESSLIEHIMVVGEGEKMVTALIVPDFENLKEWCKDNDIAYDSKEKIVENETVIERYEKILENKNSEFSHVEQVKKFRLVPAEWTVESGELTPTQKVKRPVVKDKHKKLIEEMYKEE